MTGTITMESSKSVWALEMELINLVYEFERFGIGLAFATYRTSAELKEQYDELAIRRNDIVAKIREITARLK